VTLRVGVLGTGNMGGAMVGTLRRAGHEVVLWSRTASKAEAVAGPIDAEVAMSPSAAVERSDIVLSSLADDEAVLDVYLGKGGAVHGARKGQVLLEMSTIAPDTVLRVGREVEDRGATLLDAPVSGSVSKVAAGDLTIMVGGDAAALERARPVLDALATKVFHVGDSGAGATMKLAVNALVHAIDVGVSEALVLAEKAGVERAAAYDVFASGAAAAPFVLYKRAAFEHPETTPVAFTLDLMAKDLDLILGLAREVGARMDQAKENRRLVGEALERGFSGRDLSAVAEYLRS
jgi:3-hydroxyisobutyrate dehydrogenase-like beta-hydroxyacid dehydrogenase